MITTLFFDLDGTLLPMDLEGFTTRYLQTIAKTMQPYGFEPKKLAAEIFQGVKVMTQPEEGISNEEAFWQYFESLYGPSIRAQIPLFNQYYQNEFNLCKDTCPANPEIPGLIEKARELGFRVILATNPIFPRTAVESRLAWAGLKPEDFDFITSYENSSFCKPDPRYFLQTARAAGVNPDEVLMIGNDLNEDYGAIKAGMPLYILTDCLIESETNSLDDLPHGSVKDLEVYLENLAASQKAD